MTVDEDTLEQLIQGNATGFGGGYGIGTNITNPWGEKNNGFILAEPGIFSPQLGINVARTGKVYDANPNYPTTVNLWNSRYDYWYWYHYE